jgi:hypothetical protein
LIAYKLITKLNVLKFQRQFIFYNTLKNNNKSNFQKVGMNFIIQRESTIRSNFERNTTCASFVMGRALFPEGGAPERRDL